MLTFLRKIRKSLIDSGSARKYLLYAIGETALVVLGILIALQVNNWNENKKDRKKEKILLINLKSEIQQNLDQLVYIRDEKEKIQNDIKYVLQFTGESGAWDSEISFDSIMYSVIISGWKYYPIDGVQSDILNSGKLDLITNDSLRQHISSLPRYWKYAWPMRPISPASPPDLRRNAPASCRFLDNISIKLIVKSATAPAFRPGVFNTSTPAAVHASISMFTGFPRQAATTQRSGRS